MRKSISKLSKLRSKNSKAAGLIVTASVSHAYFIQNLMQEKLNQKAEVVSYRQNDSRDIIEAFKHSDSPWIISVGMISEGTDIPRLQVCCHLSLIKTELYFRQVLGRVLRITERGTRNAWLYTFSENNMLEFASDLSEEIPDKHTVTFDDISLVDKSILKPILKQATNAFYENSYDFKEDDVKQPKNITLTDNEHTMLPMFT